MRALIIVIVAALLAGLSSAGGFETPKIKVLVRKFKSWTSTSDECQLFIQRVEHCLSQLYAVADQRLMAQALAAEPKR
jgi:hypothetical protein